MCVSEEECELLLWREQAGHVLASGLDVRVSVLVAELLDALRHNLGALGQQHGTLLAEDQVQHELWQREEGRPEQGGREGLEGKSCVR